MDYRLLETDAGLAELIEQHREADVVVVDTEFMRRNTFYPQAALIQLCFPAEPGTAWLVDPLAIADFGPLKALFSEAGVTKVLHSASEDLEVFQRFLGCQPLPLFDTQRGAAFAGLGFGLGYRALVETVSGLELAKGETRSDWLKRPLSEGQLTYAAADVVPLLEVYRELHDRLQRCGRVDWVLEDGAAAVDNARTPVAEPHLRIKSAWKLRPRQLALLMAVCEWREQQAMSLDKPRSWILADKPCLEIARLAPTNLAELRAVPEMPPAVVRKQGEALLRLIREISERAEAELPSSMAKPLDAEQRAQLKRLKQAAADIAGRWEVEAAALLPAKDYELMVRLSSGEQLQRPSRWLGWRREELVQPLLELAGVPGSG